MFIVFRRTVDTQGRFYIVGNIASLGNVSKEVVLIDKKQSGKREKGRGWPTWQAILGALDMVGATGAGRKNLLPDDSKTA